VIVLSYASMEELHTLRKKIENRMQQAYLDENLDIPYLDDYKLLLLQTLFGQANLPDKQQTDYIVTIMLIQMALDTHDLVIRTTKTDETADEREDRQLTVLAGNYYSALYYKILAELEDIDMVALLATAIKEINEQKMALYYDTDSAAAFFRILGRMEGALFYAAASPFIKTKDLEPLVDYFIISRLSQESFMNEPTPLTIRLSIILEQDQSTLTVTEAINQELEEASARLARNLHTIPHVYAAAARKLLLQGKRQEELYLEEG
jgi:heptaprenyl diphosphate synthase